MFSCVSAQQELESELISKMDDQVNAWNRGDIDSYMKHYWKSDSLVFIGGSGPQYGWLPTLERYKKAYPDRSTMGLLSFEMLRFEALSKDAAFISGKWHLQREMGDIGGYYSLLWKKIDGSWRIVYDHTSSVKQND